MTRTRLLRDLLVAVAACLLWFALVVVGTYATLRLTPAGQLMTDPESAHPGRQDWTLLVETVPRLLSIVLATATVVAGILAGTFASGRSSAFAAAAVATLLISIEPTSAMNWVRAGPVAIALWATSTLVMRLRR